MKLTVVLLCLCVAISGCATARLPSCYKVDGKEFKEFKDLDDDRALKLISLIYNTRPQSWEEGAARSIALGEYLNLLGKRKSKYVKDSGVFQIQYDKVKVSSWSDEDLVRLQESLAPKVVDYYTDAAPDLTETQNAERIIYMTAMSVVGKELKRRDRNQQAMSVAGQLLAGALSIAISMI